MAFSIREFLEDASVRVKPHVDLEETCAREIAGLNENPSNGIWESSIYSALSSGGVPHDVLSGLRGAWEPRFTRFRQLSETGPVRTPALKLFRICAESIALRFNLSVNRVLSKSWIEFAVRPHEESRLRALLSRMVKLRVDQRWADELASTWEFLFAPGGQDDPNLKAPSLYHELYDAGSAHLKFVHPYQEDLNPLGIREFRKAELDAALSLAGEGRLTMVLGHPGWRPVARGFDLWLETLKMKLQSSGSPVADLTGEAHDPDAARSALEGFGGVAIMAPGTLADCAQSLGASARVIVMAETGNAPHELAAQGIARRLYRRGLRGEIAVLAVEHKVLNERQAGQIIFGERGLVSDDSAQSENLVRELSRNHPMLPGVFSWLADAIEEEASISGKRGAKLRLHSEARRPTRIRQIKAAPPSGAVATPGGCWSGHIDRMLALSRSRAITIGQCASPFFTMRLPLMA